MKKRNPIIIDISNIDTKAIEKTKEFVQGEAFNELSNILEQDINRKLKNKKNIHNKRTHNTIFIDGKRGSGKTQFLLSIENYIKKKNKKLKGLYFFQPIDPTLLHDNESFLTIIIAKILNNLERQKIDFQEEKNKHFYQLLTNLSNAIDGVINNKNQTKTSLENISHDQTSLRLEEYMNDFFFTIKTLLNKKRLVILIDDVDMAFDKGFEVLEVIRKYLSSPYIIPIVTGDSKLYEIIVENNFNKKLDKTLIKEYSKINKKLSIDYLIKVLPTHRRLQIKTILELADSNEILFIYNKDSYLFTCKNCNEISNEDDQIYTFSAIKDTSIFDYDIAYNNFLKKLFSHPFRNIIQYFHKEYKEGIKENQFSLKNLEEVERISKIYYLNYLKTIDSWKTFFEQGRNYFQKNDWDNAINYFYKSLNLKETEISYYFLGNSYYNLFSWEKAEEAYQNVINLNSEHSDAHFKIGATYRKRENYKKAIVFYNRSIALNPNYADAYNQLAICYVHIKKTSHAINNFKKAIKIDPNNNKPYMNIIEISFLENQYFYDKSFEIIFLKKFKNDQSVMKIYEIIKIFEMIKNKEDDKVIEQKFQQWIPLYKDIFNPNWTFLELEEVIQEEKENNIKNKFLEYLKKFKENM